MRVKMALKIKGCLFLAVSIIMNGCSAQPQTAWLAGEAGKICGYKGLEDVKEKPDEKVSGLLSAVGENISLETMKHIIVSLGKEGYVAVDSDNQMNMAGAEQVIDFCRLAKAGEEAELTMIEVLYKGGFRKYELSTKEGRLEVVRRYYQYDRKGILKEQDAVSYCADSWQYTKEGYFLFEGKYDSKESYVLSLSEEAEHRAFRVQPLEEKCREWNRKYILPVGYERNNLFLVNWKETEFGGLDFYDLFDALYPLRFGQAVPYVMGENLESDVAYRIPKQEFENVVMPYFMVDSQTLQAKTDYLPEDQVYLYKPRGFQNAEYPDIPYPEVVSYKEKDDGILELMVNAVYPNDHTSKAFSHKVEIRLLQEGGFQYVSNQVVFPEEGYDAWWREER